MERTTFPESCIDLFYKPARIIIAGFSNSGKSVLCQKIIEQNHEKFNHILYCGVDSHELQSHPQIGSKITVSSEILNPFEYSNFGSVLFILDDCFLEAAENKNVVDTFTKGRHKDISSIFITQNIFFSGKHARNIALNSSHYILMKNRDMNQVETLARQIFGKGKTREFVEIYKKAVSMNSFGYLLIDLAANTPEGLQLRTNIIGESDYQSVFQW